MLIDIFQRSKYITLIALIGMTATPSHRK